MFPQRFDVCVIGAGPAGYAAAMRAYDLGKKVLLLERDQVGGTGIRAGALSSKTLWHLSNDYAAACRTDRGYCAREVEVSYARVMATVREAVREGQALLMHQIEQLQAPSPHGGQLWFRQGNARFVSPNTVELTGAIGAAERYEADHFLIATGSTPRIPNGITVDGKLIVTSDHIEQLEGFPESLVIVGAGVVGCEYATMFGNYGKTRIFIVDRQPGILPFEDEDIASMIAHNFERMGITIHHSSTLVSLRVVDGQVEYVLCDPSGAQSCHRVERALISVGRIPNTTSLGLDKIGVHTDKTGGILVTGASSCIPHIYAAGDTTLDVALVNIAELEGRYAVEHMFGLNPRPICYEALSSIMFLSPEVASVGLNEQQALKQKIPYRVCSLRNQLVHRNIAMRDTEGFIKLLAYRDAPGKILGMRVVGPEASSTIQGIAFLIDQGATLEDIDRCVHPHPALTEGVQECARILLGRAIYKPYVYGPALIRCAEG